MSDDVITNLDDLPNVLSKEWAVRPCYFRGQPVDYPLIPSLGRRFKGELFYEVERMLLREFKNQFHANPELAREFTEPAPPADELDWHWAAFAQHHRLPTRLLDWSECPKTALFFAVANMAPSEAASDGVLYAFHDKRAVSSKLSDLNAIKNVRPFRASKVSNLKIRRIAVQNGAFTTQPIPTEDLTLQVRIDLEQRWQKWRIPRACKSRIRQQLEKDGISERVLFPDFDGLCRHVLYRVLG